MAKDKKAKKKAPSFSMGGQALIEGVMMMGTEHYAVTVRRPDQTLQAEVFGYIARRNDDVEAGDGRFLPVAAAVEGFVEVAKQFYSFIGAYPEISVVVLYESGDRRGLHFASVVGIHICHTSLAIADEEFVGSAVEPYIVAYAVPEYVVYLIVEGHVFCVKTFPSAVVVAHHETSVLQGVCHPGVAFLVEAHAACAE